MGTYATYADLPGYLPPAPPSATQWQRDKYANMLFNARHRQLAQMSVTHLRTLQDQSFQAVHNMLHVRAGGFEASPQQQYHPSLGPIQLHVNMEMLEAKRIDEEKKHWAANPIRSTHIRSARSTRIAEDEREVGYRCKARCGLGEVLGCKARCCALGEV